MIYTTVIEILLLIHYDSTHNDSIINVTNSLPIKCISKDCVPSKDLKDTLTAVYVKKYFITKLCK